MKEQKPRSDRAFQWDQWMALHQKQCWLILAALALLGAAAIALLVPGKAGTVCSVVLVVGLMLLYRWGAGAPIRAMQEWVRRLREESTPEKNQAYLDFLNQMETSLPSAQQKELAYLITLNKGYRLAVLGRKEEALSLLRSFNQIWDPSMKDRINELILAISGEKGSSANEQEEQQ